VATLAFATTGEGTRVDVTTDFLLRGSMRLMWPLIAAIYGRAWSRGLARLKAMMESGAI
jgi:hypothetical protein